MLILFISSFFQPPPLIFSPILQRFNIEAVGFHARFLVACTQLYTSLCRLVGPSVRRFVRPSVITSRFWAFRAKRRAEFSYCPCPATILPLPTRTRLMLPCIRPCWSKILFLKYPLMGEKKRNLQAVGILLFHVIFLFPCKNVTPLFFIRTSKFDLRLNVIILMLKCSYDVRISNCSLIILIYAKNTANIEKFFLKWKV